MANETNKIDIDSLVDELVNFYDIFEGAIKLAEKKVDPALSGWISGMVVLKKKYRRIFDRVGIKEIIPKIGDGLNPRLHQVQNTRTEGIIPDNCVLEIVSSGFILGEKVIRPAQVVVEYNPPSALVEPMGPETQEKSDALPRAEEKQAIDSSLDKNGNEFISEDCDNPPSSKETGVDT